MRKNFNFKEFLWFLILLGFSSYYIFLLYTGKIYVFIHPKMMGFMIFSMITFIIITIHQLKYVFSPHKSRKTYPGYILFILPLLFGFIVNPSAFTPDIIKQKGFQINQDIINSAKFGVEK